jgi:hypothetical protein
MTKRLRQMSTYAVNKLCRQIFHDETLHDAITADPDGVLDRYDLTVEERRLLKAGEVGTLFELGCHPFLLGHLTRKGTFGISVEDYSRRMRAARDDRIPPVGPAAYYTRT